MLPSFEVADHYQLSEQALCHMAAYIAGGQLDILYEAHALEEQRLHDALNGRSTTPAELRQAAEELLSFVAIKELL